MLKYKYHIKGFGLKNKEGKEDDSLKQNLLEKVLWNVAKKTTGTVSIMD